MEILADNPRSVAAPESRALRPRRRALMRLGSRRCRLRQVASLTLILVLLAAARYAPITEAPAQAASEYQLKAAFLYNFAKFIEWPPDAFADANAPIILGLIGEDPFGRVLEQTISGKTANARPLLIKRLKWGENLRDCTILFISASERKRLAQIFESVKGAGVLTVSEMERFAQLGGVVNFTMKENKVGFEINVDAAERARLKISSKLLSLAKVLSDEQRAGKN